MRIQVLFPWCLVWLTALAPADTLANAATINGIVVASESGDPIAGAQVILLKRNFSVLGNLLRGGMDAPPTVIGKTNTDIKGHFSFAAVSGGQYEITAYDRKTRSNGVVQVKSTSEFIRIVASKLPPRPKLFPAEITPKRKAKSAATGRQR